MSTYSFVIRREIHECETAVDARNLYEWLRDESDEGASTWPTPALYKDGKVIGWFCYNGRISARKEWSRDAVYYDAKDL